MGFKKEVDFYTMKKLAAHKKAKKHDKRQKSCNSEEMFENMMKLLEEEGGVKRMPVRKFLNNLATLLNDAIFALLKKQSKEP